MLFWITCDAIRNRRRKQGTSGMNGWSNTYRKLHAAQSVLLCSAPPSLTSRTTACCLLSSDGSSTPVAVQFTGVTLFCYIYDDLESEECCQALHPHIHTKTYQKMNLLVQIVLISKVKACALSNNFESIFCPPHVNC